PPLALLEPLGAYPACSGRFRVARPDRGWALPSAVDPRSWPALAVPVGWPAPPCLAPAEACPAGELADGDREPAAPVVLEADGLAPRLGAATGETLAPLVAEPPAEPFAPRAA